MTFHEFPSAEAFSTKALITSLHTVGNVYKIINCKHGNILITEEIQ